MNDNNPGPLDGVLSGAAEAVSLEVDGHGNRKITGAKRGMCAAILTFEAIALGLSTPVMITVASVSAAVAVPIGVGLCVLCILLAGMLRRPWAYFAGHVVQAAAVALGFVVPMMFVVGGLFALLWFTAYWLGGKIEREKAEAYAAYDAEQGSLGSEA